MALAVAALLAPLASNAVNPALGQPAMPTARLAALLEQRVVERPDDAASWRLLGRARLEEQDIAGALAACRQAVLLDPQSASAHFDLGATLLAAGQTHQAAGHLKVAVELAPESDYAAEACGLLEALVEQGTLPESELATFEPSWLAEPPAAEPLATEELRAAYLRLETGLLFNSNVQLAPISRELSTGEVEGFQFYMAPEFEYRTPPLGCWQSGMFLRTYFSFNEGPLSQYNLEHVQPGVFLEGPSWLAEGELVPRLTYDFSYDAFDGRTLGTRHGLTASLLGLRELRTWLLYAGLSHTDFRDEGADPTATSMDGVSYTLGSSVEEQLAWVYLSRIRLGGELEWAPVSGSTFAYRGVLGQVSGDVPLPCQWLMVLHGALGFRDYYRFELEPSRNEMIWRAGVELRRPLGDHWTLSGLVQYDRFASGNDLFDARRLLAGSFLTFEW